MQTLEQIRARDAWRILQCRFGDVTDNWKNKEKGASKYLGALRKTPAHIYNCGLGQALAFLKSRNKQQPKDVYDDLSKLVLNNLGMTGDSLDLLQKIRDKDSDASFLFLVTDETVRVIGWLARYLEGAGVKAQDEDVAADTAQVGQETPPDEAQE